MNGGYIDERGRVKKIAVCKCNFPIQRELCCPTTLPAAACPAPLDFYRFFSGLFSASAAVRCPHTSYFIA
jgi:hypothetical protein